MELLQAYPYLVTNLGNLALLIVLLVPCPPLLRRIVVMGALVTLPAAFQELIDVPTYWNPARVFVLAGIGPEDLLCAFVGGGFCCLLAMWPFRTSLVLEWRRRELPRRFLLVAAMGCAARLLLQVLGAGASTELSASVAFLALAMLCLRPRQWRLAATGMILFTPVYFLLVKLAFTAAPNYLAQWNQANLLGPMVWGVPLDEIVWSACSGAAVPMSVAYILGVRLAREGDRITPEKKDGAVALGDRA